MKPVFSSRPTNSGASAASRGCRPACARSTRRNGRNDGATPPVISRTVNAMAGRIRIGISGWRYAGWRGVFYPKKLAQGGELEFGSGEVETVEINGSHYSLQSLSSWRAWHEATPDAFIFSVKGPRYLTHMLRF